MADLSRLQAEVEENSDVVASAATLLGQLSQLIRDNATDEAALLALADDLDTNNAALAAAVATNTPDAPTEPETPETPAHEGVAQVEPPGV